MKEFLLIHITIKLMWCDKIFEGSPERYCDGRDEDVEGVSFMWKEKRYIFG
jgi:hypothetical protein